MTTWGVSTWTVNMLSFANEDFLDCWNVTPFPVDYRTDSAPDWYDFSLRYGPALWELALHETLGYWVYRLAGRI